MKFTLTLPDMIERINEKSTDIKIFEDKVISMYYTGVYYVLFSSGRWVTLNKEEPQTWLVDELIQEYWSLLYAENHFSDDEWEKKEATIFMHLITFKVPLKHNRKIIFP